MYPIKINVPKGFSAKFDETKGEVSFEPIPKHVTERIKSIDDAVAELGEADPDVQLLKRLDKSYGHLYWQQQAVVITKALNEKWVADWGNTSEWKYYPWFRMGGSSGSGFSYHSYADGYSGSNVGSRLVFKSSELAEYAGTQFTEIYKQFFLI